MLNSFNHHPQEGLLNHYSPVIAAHRGASADYPENTLAAIKHLLFISRRYPSLTFFVEVDVRSSKDGKMVLMHDASALRMTGNKRFIEDMYSQEIELLAVKKSRSQPIGSSSNNFINPNITAADFRVPSLDEVMQVISQHNKKIGRGEKVVGLAIDLKPAYRGKPRFEPILSVLSSVWKSLGLERFLIKESGVKSENAARNLSKLFNHYASAKQKTAPVLIFSSSGYLGKRALEAFWSGLSAEAKKDFFLNAKTQDIQMPLYSPKMHFEALGIKGYLFAICHKISEITRSFWCVLPSDRKNISPSFLTLDTEVEIDKAICKGADWITTNRPEVAAQCLMQYFKKLSKDQKESSYNARFDSTIVQQDKKKDIENVKPRRI